MRNLTKVLSLTICIYSLTACTSIGSYIMSNPGVYLSEAEFIKEKPNDIGFEKHSFCSDNTTQCISFLTAKPYQAVDFSPDSSIYYNLHAVGNNVENTISHRMKPNTFNRFRGTALLLHGYGGSKESMIVTAIYFRAIGMNVVIPDLFGHGDSNENFAFGAKEHDILNELLAKLSLNQSDTRTIVVGHSMGALTASNLLSSENVEAAILLAPMMSFELAAKEYLPYKSPLLSRFFYSRIDDIVNQTMVDAAVNIQETNLLGKLTDSIKPVLLVNSDVDSLSPPAYFSKIQNKLVEKVTLKNRSHSSLMVFDRNDVDNIESWLTALQVFAKADIKSPS